jgi:hypothetical protein
MKIQEFNEAVSQYRRRTLTVLGFILLLMVPYFTLVLTFVDRLRRFYTVNFGEGTADVLMGLSPLPALIALLVGLGLNDRRAKRAPRLYCQHCAKEMYSSQQLTIATRNCPHCGKTVLEEPR